MEDLVVETVRETAEKNVLEVYHGRFEVIAAKLGDDAGVRAPPHGRRKIFLKISGIDHCA